MNKTEVLLSVLAANQLSELSPKVGRAMVKALTRLATFPESGSPLRKKGYKQYRIIVVMGYQAIYRYLPHYEQVRVYCIFHTRRQLPKPEFLIYQIF